MRKIVIILILVLSPFLIRAQLNHYISYNTLVKWNFCSEYTDVIDLNQSLRLPMGSYKIEKERIGGEVFLNTVYAFYNPIQQGVIKDGDLSTAQSTNIGVCLQYKVLDKSFLNISCLFGGIKNWYWGSGVIRFPNPFEVSLYSNRESKWGLLSGVNINVPIYKSYYANANFRYSVFPTAEYNKRNLITEFGVGYRLTSRANKE